MSELKQSEQKICKKSWKTSEDALLLELVTEYGLNGKFVVII